MASLNKPPMTKAAALAACVKARNAPIFYDVNPVEAGMGGCPWRVAIAVIVSKYARIAVCRVLLRKLFKQWPTPELLADSDSLDHAMLYLELSTGQRRARTVRALTEAWVAGEWETVIDLPGVGKDVCAAIERYAGG